MSIVQYSITQYAVSKHHIPISGCSSAGTGNGDIAGTLGGVGDAGLC